ncbi:MAG: ABC transporter permease [Armatimonadota bacterium]|nr:ABC transporter permease [Armatimonadota bacterium]MDR7470516.1 ABC transporter permease [Armatimonadota bacterium]MDR7475488.1 ABC transporter permease [Armatimonadota bacterium]MDR7540281.1 ABC transporter permease [Armatimonadota bacterium]
MIRRHRPAPAPRERWALWLLLPITTWQVLFYLTPALFLLLASFWVMREYRLTPAWTLQNYRVFFQEFMYLKAYVLSLGFATSTVLLTVLVAYPFAYALAFCVPPRARLVALVAVIAPFWTNYLVRGYAWQTILANNGVLNYLLLRLGVISAPLDILYTLTAARIGLVHFLLAIMTLILYSTLEGIDKSLLEAAADLGANRLRAFTEVIFPLSSGGLVAGSMFTFVLAFADFVSPAVLGGQAQRVFPQLVVDAVQWTVNWPQASAFAVIMVVTILGTIAVFGRWMRFAGFGRGIGQ